MPEYKELRTTAFSFRPDALALLTGDYRALDFPREWIEPLLRHLSEGKDHARRVVPIHSLNMAMRAFVPDNAAVGRGVGLTDHDGGWLYSAHPTDSAALEPLVQAWVYSLRSDLGPAVAEDVWNRLERGAFNWRHLAPTELGWPTTQSTEPDEPAATAAIAALPRSLFSLVPSVLTTELLARNDRPARVGRAFRRCPTADGRGVELISWPPFDRDDDEPSPWSYRVTLTAQTRPFQPEPILHVTTGIRRWCHQTPYTGGRSVGLYMLTELPWIQGLRTSSSFHVAPVRARKVDGQWRLVWHRKLQHLFAHLTFQRELPDLAALQDDPVALLAGDSPAALVYTTTAGFTPTIQAGTHARERDMLVTWVEETLADFITPAPTMTRTEPRFRNHTPPTPIQRRTAVAATTDGKLTVDLLWDTEPVRDALINAIAADLDLPPSGTGQYTYQWITGQLDLTVRCRAIGGLGEALEPDGRIRNRDVRNRRAVAARRTAVRDELGPATSRTVCLVELRDHDSFPAAGTDPKHALRLGLADTHRLSQFITPLDERPNMSQKQREKAIKALPERAAASWADLRRQLAARAEPLRTHIDRLAVPDPVDYLAIWMIRRNSTRSSWSRHQLPVAVWMSSDRYDIQARALGSNDWQSYPQLLLSVAKNSGLGLPTCDEEEATRFVHDIVKLVCTDPKRPVLLLTSAQNLRNSFTSLRNSELLIDTLGSGAIPLPITQHPQLRHVRIRTADGHETPQCYGIAETSDDAEEAERTIGLSRGLWTIPGSSRVFASTAVKPASAKRHGVAMSHRLETRPAKSGDAFVDDTKPSWSPQFVELTVAAMQPGDDPLVWASLAHALRRKADDYKGELTYPLPLHLAKLITQYALPSTDDDASEQDDETETIAEEQGSDIEDAE